MKYIIICLLLNLLFRNESYSQNLTVRVTDLSGNSLEAVSVFIPEINKGLASTIIKNSINAAPSLLNAANYYDAISYINGKMIKSELIYQNVYKTRKQAYYAVFEYMEGFYNTNRKHSHLGYLTIREFNELQKFNHKKKA